MTQLSNEKRRNSSLTKKKSFLGSAPRDNFINILQTRFMYQRELSSFFLITFDFEIFSAKILAKKSCLKCWCIWHQNGKNKSRKAFTLAHTFQKGWYLSFVTFWYFSTLSQLFNGSILLLVNDHLQITTTCLQQQFQFLYHKSYIWANTTSQQHNSHNFWSQV